VAANVKTIFLFMLPVLAGIAAGDGMVQKRFHHCSIINGSGNEPHLFDISEVYSCDEGQIEISGQTREIIEYGYIYTTEMGRPSREAPRVATEKDYKSSKWCSTPTPWDKNQKERCGDKPHMCFDGKPGTWDEKWQGYSCVTPDHH
jgi:hypothetical protein